MSDFDFDKSFSDDLRRERFYEPDDDRWAALAAALDRRERLEIRRRRIYHRWLPSLAAAAVVGIFATAWWQADRRADALETRVGQLETQVSTKKEADFSTQKMTQPTEKTTAETNPISTEKTAPSSENTTSSTDFSTKNTASTSQKSVVSEKQKQAVAASSKPNEAPFSEKSATDFSKKSTAAQPISASEKPTVAPDFQKQEADSPSPNETLFSEKKEAATTISQAENLENAPSAPLENASKMEALASAQRLKNWTALPSISLKPIDFQRKTPDLSRFRADFFVAPIAENLTRPVKTHRRFAVGPTVGWSVPVDKKVEKVSGSSLGIEGQFFLKKGARLTGGVGFEHAFFDLKDPDSLKPQVPHGPDEKVEQARVESLKTSFSLGVRYDFFEKNRVRPFASLAWAGNRVQKKETNFHFKDPHSGGQPPHQEKDHEPPGAWTLNLAKIGAGAAWRLTPRLEWSVQTTWQEPLGSGSKGSSESQFAATTGLFFQF